MIQLRQAVAAVHVAVAPILSAPGGALAAQNYLCFEGLSDQQNMLCYPHAETFERDAAVEESIGQLAEKLDRGEPLGKLVTLSAELAQFYSREKFAASLRKSFPLLSSDSVTRIVHYGEHSVALLPGRSMLFFSHAQQSFIFSFNEPTPLAGLAYYYGRGAEPGEWHGELPASNCNLSRDGITFVGPSRDHLLYREAGSFCAYDGYYFKPAKADVQVRRVDQIGQRQSLISANGFTAFLQWLGNKQ